MLKYRMPTFLFTFRSHVSEPKLFNTFLTIFFNSQLLKSFSEYTYNIEKDGTLDAHLHIFFTTTMRDKEKVYKAFQVKEFKQFSQYLKNKATIKQYGFDVRLVGKDKSKDDRLYTIGYVNKEAKHTRDNLPITYHNIDMDEILKAVEYYAEYTKIDKVKLENSHDIRILTSKNVHITILDYLEKNKGSTNHEDPLLFHKMAADGLFTDFITEQQKANISESISIYLTKDIEKYATLPDAYDNPCWHHVNNSFQYALLKDQYKELKEKYEELLEQQKEGTNTW